MATCNLNQCLRALEAQNLQAELVTGKNPKQVLKVLLADGRVFKTGTTYTQQEFEELFQLTNDTSMARSKVEGGHVHARTQENICDDVQKIQNWLDQQACYVKKHAYSFSMPLVSLLNIVFEDYSIMPQNYDSIKVFNNPDVIIKNDRVCSRHTLEQFCKLWLAENKQYEKYGMGISQIVKKWELAF